MPHFGVVLPMEKWQRLVAHLKETQKTQGIQGIQWVIEPHVRFKGEAGEQGTFFLTDPSGNALEFKGFTNLKTVFAS